MFQLHARNLELEWMRRRALQAGSCNFGNNRDTGRSSNAMCEYALGGPHPELHQYPYDIADLMACRRAIEGAPAHLRAVMEPLFEKYQKRVRENHPKADRAWLKHRAVCPGRNGRSYVKRCKCKGLPWSDLKPHPPLGFSHPYASKRGPW